MTQAALNLVPQERNAIAEFEITPAKVAAMAEDYKKITVPPEDTKAYKMARSALTICVSTRTGVDKRRKDLGEDARKWVAEVNQAAKDLLAPLAPVEDHLRAELQREDARKAEIKEAEAKKEAERIDTIRAKIAAMVNAVIIPPWMQASDIEALAVTVESWNPTPEEYQEFTPEANKVKHDCRVTVAKALEERRKFEAEELARRAESERIAKVAAEQAAEAARLVEEKRLFEEAQAAEKKRVEAEKREQAELAKAAKEKFDARLHVVAKFGGLETYTLSEIQNATDEEFNRMASELEAIDIKLKTEAAAAKKDLEDRRKAQEEADRIAKAERDVEIAALKKDLDWQQAIIDDQKFDLDRERAVLERIEIEKKLLAEAKERAEREAAELIERKKAEAEIKSKRDAEEKERAEALKPDLEKLETWAGQIADMQFPKGIKDERITKLASDAMTKIYAIANETLAAAEAL